MPSLSRNRDFRVFLGGQGVSAFGDAITITALPLLVLLLTGSGVTMGVVGVLTTLPDLLIGLPAGALADRWDRRRLMVYADVGRASLTALVPLSLVLGLDTVAVIILVTAPINALRVLFLAAFTGAVPNLVEREQIARANGMVEGILSLSFIVGPAAAGILVGVIGPAATLAIDAISFLFSAGALFLIRRPLQAERQAAGLRPSIATDIAEGVRFILRDRTLRAIISFWSLSSVILAPLVAAVIFHLTVDRQRPPEVVGVVLSGYGMGYFLGAILAGRVAGRPAGVVMILGNLGTALALVLFVVGGSGVFEVLGAAGAGLAGAPVLIAYITLRATIPPDALLGRVGSTARTMSLGLQPVGLFAGGVLLDAVGGGATVLLVAGLLAALTALFALSATVRDAAVPPPKTA